MEYIVLGHFPGPNSAQDAFNALLYNGFCQENIAFQTHATPYAFRSSPPSGYDPLGGARLFGHVFTTLSTTGDNLVGNSTTVDVSLNDMSSILEKLIAQEDNGVLENESNCYLKISSIVRVNDPDEAERVSAIMHQHGARNVDIKPRKSYN